MARRTGSAVEEGFGQGFGQGCGCVFGIVTAMLLLCAGTMVAIYVTCAGMGTTIKEANRREPKRERPPEPEEEPSPEERKPDPPKRRPPPFKPGKAKPRLTARPVGKSRGHDAVVLVPGAFTIGEVGRFRIRDAIIAGVPARGLLHLRYGASDFLLATRTNEAMKVGNEHSLAGVWKVKDRHTIEGRTNPRLVEWFLIGEAK